MDYLHIYIYLSFIMMKTLEFIWNFKLIQTWMLPRGFALLNENSHSVGVKTKPRVQPHSCFHCGGRGTEVKFGRVRLKQL